MPKQSSPLSGLLIVDKPGLPFDWQTAGRDLSEYDLPTSHDVVQQVRRASRQRRIGHTGTLDPMASGVLVLCLGQATRLVEYYQGHAKQYQAEITLGAATDTYDALGEVTARGPVPPLTAAMIDEALANFRGEIDQRPPIYSALKQGGESLHRKARRGETVEIEARRITIHDLTLVDWIEPNRLRVQVRGSAGTYVRSLAHDLGQALGTYGHLSGLRREAAGPFTLADAHTLDMIVAADQAIEELLLPPGWGLTLPQATIDSTALQRFGFGQKVWLQESAAAQPAGSLVQAIDEQGAFVGIVRCLEAGTDAAPGGLWKAEKWFANE